MLRAEGIRAILLKGPVTAQWLYPGHAPRSYFDVDLLVAPGEFQRALRTLEDFGYRNYVEVRDTVEGAHAVPLRLDGRSGIAASQFPAGLSVDLHWSFDGIGASDEVFWTVIAADAEQMLVSGREVEVPSEPARALLLALHAGTSHGSFRQPLTDLDRALEWLPDDTWRAARRLAMRLDALPRFTAGLAVRPLGLALIDRLGLKGALDVRSALYAGGAPPAVADGLVRLRAAGGVGPRVRLLARALIPTRASLRFTHPRLARLGTPGLVLAYMYRPVWLLAKLPAALRAYAQARRAFQAGDLGIPSPAGSPYQRYGTKVTEHRQVVTVNDFFPGAADMRRAFEERLGARRGAERDRFVWDYWHVPDQYTYIRTFADEFFPSTLYGGFRDHLMAWGRENLGCTRIVSPWLSYYVDGCRQELHSDIPHGPWAYVFSLTNWDKRTFTGGETVLLREHTLDFWRSYAPSRSGFSELTSFVELIEPCFNRLTVFDPRIPHGVRLVEGTREPLDSRIAVHGWFTEPAVILSEAIEEPQQRRVFEATLAMLLRSLRDVDGVHGLVTARVDVSSEGKVADTRIVSSSLISTGDDSVESIERAIIDFLASSSFPPTPGEGWAVIPVPLPVAQGRTE